jgi:hypothetical protein
LGLDELAEFACRHRPREQVALRFIAELVA